MSSDSELLHLNNSSTIGCDLSDVKTNLNNILDDTSINTNNNLNIINNIDDSNKKKNITNSNNNNTNNKEDTPFDNAYDDGINIFNELRQFKRMNNYDSSDEQKKIELSESFFNSIKDKYSFFFATFPLIVKFMFNLMLFHPIGFREFLTFYFNTNPSERHNNMSENIKLNCKYVYFVYIHVLNENNGLNGKKKDKKDTIIHKALKFESNIFNMTIKEYDHIITSLKKNEDDIKTNKKERLIEYIKNQKK